MMKVLLISPNIESLMELGINNVFIVDNEFNYPVEHAQKNTPPGFFRGWRSTSTGRCRRKFVVWGPGALVGIYENGATL